VAARYRSCDRDDARARSGCQHQDGCRLLVEGSEPSKSPSSGVLCSIREAMGQGEMDRPLMSIAHLTLGGVEHRGRPRARSALTSTRRHTESSCRTPAAERLRGHDAGWHVYLKRLKRGTGQSMQRKYDRSRGGETGQGGHEMAEGLGRRPRSTDDGTASRGRIAQRRCLRSAGGRRRRVTE
jgi:hypothetical protein